MTCFPYLGGEIARLCRASGVMQQNLARLVGVRDVTIFNLAQGKFFKTELLEWIQLLLGVRLSISSDNADKAFVCACYA